MDSEQKNYIIPKNQRSCKDCQADRSEYCQKHCPNCGSHTKTGYCKTHMHLMRGGGCYYNQFEELPFNCKCSFCTDGIVGESGFGEFNLGKKKGKQERLVEPLKFLYGNDCEPIENNKFKWTVYVRPHEDNTFEMSAMINKVVFKLHPTFKPNEIGITKPPFQLTRIGWGTFKIKIIIYWNSIHKNVPTELEHELNFGEDGEVSELEVYDLV
jgi:hypothetical protein